MTVVGELGSVLASLACAWVFPLNPAFSPSRCEVFAYPPRVEAGVFTFHDEAYGLRLEDVVESKGVPPADLMMRDPELTPELQRWVFRNVAHHLGRVHDYVRLELGRTAPARPITVRLTRQYSSQGLMRPPEIHLGGAGALSSDIIYHEYGHHLLEWEKPGITRDRGTADGNPEGYSIVEAYANHLAYVLDDEPRFGEYMQARLGGAAFYAYSVETDCSVKRCDQAVVKYGPTFPVVVGFGALLWDVKKRYGGAESLNLMLDSVGLLDLKSPLSYKSALEALVRAAGLRSAAKIDMAWLRERGCARWGDEEDGSGICSKVSNGRRGNVEVGFVGDPVGDPIGANHGLCRTRFSATEL